VKTVSNCIFSVPLDGSYTLHAYGSSRAWVDGFLVRDNIAHGRGPFLIGGGRPSRNIRVLGNRLHGVDMRIGYGAENEDCEVAGNTVIGGAISIEKYRVAVERDNVRDLEGKDLAVLIPGRYDPSRAHVASYLAHPPGEASIGVRDFLEAGDRFAVLDPRDVFGKPLLEGASEGDSIRVPQKGPFAAWVIVRKD
jgi:hypothetical protein